MPLYVTPILGTGGDTDRFRPIGLEQPGMGWVDLRPDQTVSTGRGLLWLPVHDPDIRLIRLADAPGEALTLTRRTQLANALGLTLSGSKFADLAAEILGRNARTDGTRWRPLAIRHDGVFEIWLGSANGGKPIWMSDQLAGGVAPWFFAALGMGLRPHRRWGRREFLAGAGTMLAALLVARKAHAAIWTEPWPTNGTNIATGQDQPWNEDSGDVQVTSNHLEVVAAGGGRKYGRCLSNVATDNHTVRLDATIVRDGLILHAIWVTARKIDSTTETFYALRTKRSTVAGEDERALTKHVAGTVTDLSGDNTDSGSPITIFVTCNGSTISGGIGGVTLFTSTDTGITGNVQGGYAFNLAGAGVPSDLQIDNWSIADPGVGVGVFGPVPLRTILGVGQ